MKSTIWTIILTAAIVVMTLLIVGCTPAQPPFLAQEPTGPCTAAEIIERSRTCDSATDESKTREIGLLLSSIAESFARPGVYEAFCTRATPDRIGDLEQIARENYGGSGTALTSSRLSEDDFTFVFLYAVTEACD